MSPPRIPVSRPEIGEKERRYVLEAVDSGWVSSLGDFIGRFESGFARYCDVPHGVAVSNGTTALEVALAELFRETLDRAKRLAKDSGLAPDAQYWASMKTSVSEAAWCQVRCRS